MTGAALASNDPRLRWSVASRAEIVDRLRRLSWRLRRPGRPTARSISVPVVILACAALAVAALMFAFDERISLAARREPAGARAFLAILTDVGLILWYFYPALTVSVLLLATKAEPADRRVRMQLYRSGIHSAYLAASLGVATSITHGLKWLLGRARPPLLEEEGVFGFELLRVGSAFESFPSGHSTNMGVVAVVLAVWLPSLRWLILIAGAAFAMTRIVVEAHFASDVVAGFAIGAITALCLGRYLALRGIVYRSSCAGAGWRGLLPFRPEQAARLSP